MTDDPENVMSEDFLPVSTQVDTEPSMEEVQQTLEYYQFLKTPEGQRYLYNRQHRALINLPREESEDTADQLAALEEKLDSVLTFMTRLLPLVEYAEKMMLATRKEQVKMFLAKGK
jgi:hypothetical protein